MTVTAFRLKHKELIPLDFSASTLDELTGRVSDGFYTTFSTLSGGTRVLGLRAHLDRLYLPAKEFHLRPSADVETLRRHIADIATEFLPSESRVRLVLTKDTGDVYIGAQPFLPPPESAYRDGVHVITANVARHDPRIKGTDFITQSAEQRKLVKGDIFEILLAHEGNIFEGMTSNFYAVISSVIASPSLKLRVVKKSQSLTRGLLRREEHTPRNDGKIITAQKGILLGVTRRAVLRIARGEGLSIEYRSPRTDENFDEAFLTSSSRGIVPIVSIDNKPVGQGRVGNWAKRLSTSYWEYVQRKSERIIPE